MAFHRFDKGDFRQPTVTKEGFLRADAYVTRAGVFPYRRADGSIVRELRPVEEVFQADSLASLQLAPMTLDHPGQPVDATNAKQLSVGHLGDGVAREAEYVRAPVFITDAAAVREVLEGRRRETSCGYTCDVDETPGEFNGEPYDCVQRNIRYNHVALVARGRAGPEVRVRLDSDSAEQVLPESKNDTGGTVPIKRRIRGIEFEVSEQLEQALARLDDDHAEALRSKDTELATLKTDLEKVRGRADQLDADLKKAQKERADAADPARIASLVRARVDLEKVAHDILGAEFKTDADDASLRRAVIAKVSPDAKLEGKPEAYIEARFDSAVETFRKANPVAGARHGTAPEKPEDAQRADVADPSTARDRMIASIDKRGEK